MNKAIIEEFRNNDGVVGGMFEGMPLLLLHHTGAKSGRERLNPLVYRTVDGRFVIFASKAGADTNPDWYHNVTANPNVTIEVGTDEIEAVAVELSGDERDEWTALPPAPGLSESDAVSGRHVALFPNVMISLLPNHACTFLLEPLGAGRTRERITWSLPHEPDPQAFAELRQFWVDVNNEDIDICERAQRGIAAGRFGGGRLSPRFEEPLHRFYNMLADRFVGVNRLPDGDPSDTEPQYGEGTNPVPWVEPEKG